ncbi:hypothetical protein [Thermoactinomyces sp. DSM 45892]|uniref:hypothetical protein n=1 Tax=Thermoactinomyces sp. DSM 45892 TaxID=1882753 RepID=UPI000895046A|nr:hypothetical protein [Thermoactinomyces sp. DSM 45892]SDY70180.1 hypothetical protein SAMN05444416_107117 [Thermoactinomyces sp. DSM 45892]
MKESGFSFIETIIACTILCTVIGFVVPIFRSEAFNETKVRFHEDAREIAQNKMEHILAIPASKLRHGYQVEKVHSPNQTKQEFRLHTWVKQESDHLIELEVKVEWIPTSTNSKKYDYTLHSYRLVKGL